MNKVFRRLLHFKIFATYYNHRTASINFDIRVY